MEFHYEKICNLYSCLFLAISCTVQDLPQTVELDECTNSNKLQSICTFKCVAGYHVQKKDSLVAICTTDGVWDNTPSACSGKCSATKPFYSLFTVNNLITRLQNRLAMLMFTWINMF